MEVVYSYRQIDGVIMPSELDPRKDDVKQANARAYRRERRAMWAAWQRLGLPLPDPDTGRTWGLKHQGRLPADLPDLYLAEIIPQGSASGQEVSQKFDEPLQLALPGLTLLEKIPKVSSAAD